MQKTRTEADKLQAEQIIKKLTPNLKKLIVFDSLLFVEKVYFERDGGSTYFKIAIIREDFILPDVVSFNVEVGYYSIEFHTRVL